MCTDSGSAYAHRESTTFHVPYPLRLEQKDFVIALPFYSSGDGKRTDGACLSISWLSESECFLGVHISTGLFL